MAENDSSRGERRLIADLRRFLCRPTGDRPRAGGDDLAAVDPTGGVDVLWSADLLMDGVDFDSGVHDWRVIGGKALLVNLSDCAACGARPLSCLLSLSLDNRVSYDDALRLAEGLVEVADRYDCPLMGGDTNSWDHPTVINVTVAAAPPVGLAPVGRDGARPGDLLCLTGSVGGSLLGRHLVFEPRLALGAALAARGARAMIDISDGVAIDLWHLCDESGCGAEIDAAVLDRMTHADAHRRAAATGDSARAHALFDGEDFELLAALPADANVADLGVTVLGRFVAETGVVLRDGTRRESVPRRGWEHFRDG